MPIPLIKPNARSEDSSKDKGNAMHVDKMPSNTIKLYNFSILKELQMRLIQQDKKYIIFSNDYNNHIYKDYIDVLQMDLRYAGKLSLRNKLLYRFYSQYFNKYMSDKTEFHTSNSNNSLGNSVLNSAFSISKVLKLRKQLIKCYLLNKNINISDILFLTSDKIFNYTNHTNSTHNDNKLSLKQKYINLVNSSTCTDTDNLQAMPGNNINYTHATRAPIKSHDNTNVKIDTKVDSKVDMRLLIQSCQHHETSVQKLIPGSNSNNIFNIHSVLSNELNIYDNTEITSTVKIIQSWYVLNFAALQHDKLPTLNSNRNAIPILLTSKISDEIKGLVFSTTNFFKYWPDDITNYLFSLSYIAHFNSQDSISIEGEPLSYVFIVLEGTIETVCMHKPKLLHSMFPAMFSCMFDRMKKRLHQSFKNLEFTPNSFLSHYKFYINNIVSTRYINSGTLMNIDNSYQDIHIKKCLDIFYRLKASTISEWWHDIHQSVARYLENYPIYFNYITNIISHINSDNEIFQTSSVKTTIPSLNKLNKMKSKQKEKSAINTASSTNLPNELSFNRLIGYTELLFNINHSIVSTKVISNHAKCIVIPRKAVTKCLNFMFWKHKNKIERNQHIINILTQGLNESYI